MKRPELLSRMVVIAGALLAIGAPVYFRARTPIIHARMAENGGWNPDIIQAKMGQPLHLKLTSDDVVHGFAIGQMDMTSIDIEPGKVTEITLAFDKPGTYTYYCTRWCGPNHWRMRGTIEVTGASAPPEPVSEPLYVSLGLNIDEPHDSPIVPGMPPSSSRGQQLAADLSIDLAADYYRSHSPFQAFSDIPHDTLSEAQRWDVVAYIWQSNTTPDSLANGQELYAQNCAACHGEYGSGDGVFADDLSQAGEASVRTMNGTPGMAMQTPVDFIDPKRLLGASPALLQGKILRGGMGTGMPMWGVIFTEDQIWDLIAYLYSFQFEYQE